MTRIPLAARIVPPAETHPAQPPRIRGRSSMPDDPEASREDPGVSGPADRAVRPGRLLVSLEQFEGTLERLIELVRRRKLEVVSLPLAELTGQYLSRLEEHAPEVEAATEFVGGAATLIQIKSRALLPAPPAVEPETEEDPSTAQAERESLQVMAKYLRKQRAIREKVLPAGVSDDTTGGDEEAEANLETTLFDLVRAFDEVLERERQQPVVEMMRSPITVASRIGYLLELLRQRSGPLPLRQVLREQRSTAALVATFLALLEMVRASVVELSQQQLFGEIIITMEMDIADAADRMRVPVAVTPSQGSVQ